MISGAGMNGTIFILDNILYTIIISTQRLFTIKMGFQIDLRSFLCPFAAYLLETLKKKKHRGCLVLSANKAIPDSGEVTGRSCTTEYDLGAICHNRCSCERRQHPPAKCQHLSKQNNICRQQQCNCWRRRNELQIKRCQVYCLAALSTKSLYNTVAVSDASMVTMRVESVEAMSMNDHE